MPTVDLPAHNVTAESIIGGTPDVTIIGGAECLATTDTATGVVLSATTEGFFVGNDVASLGFGLWTKPAGATVTDVRFVAHAYREGGGVIPGGTYDATYTNTPSTYPMLMLDYQGDLLDGGFNIAVPDAAYGEALCAVQLRHLIGADDYVISGIGSPASGTFGLCPRVYVDPNYPNWPTPPNITVRLAYLAIRITYTAGRRLAHQRGMQRGSDAQGVTGGKRGMQKTSRQASLRGGSFL